MECNYILHLNITYIFRTKYHSVQIVLGVHQTLASNEPKHLLSLFQALCIFYHLRLDTAWHVLGILLQMSVVS